MGKFKSAFTLIELLVYMAILGFVVVVAGRVFSDATGMRVRSQNMVKSAEALGNVSNILREDISQMGVKAGAQEEASVYTVTVQPRVYWNPVNPAGDSSSYVLISRPIDDTTFFDSLVFRKAAFDEQGRFIAVREISWFAREDNRKLYRKCATIAACTGAGCGGPDGDLDICPAVASANEADTVLVAERLTNFRLTPSAPGLGGSVVAGDTLFPVSNANPNFRLVSRNNVNYENDNDIGDIQHNISGDDTRETVISSFLAKNAKNQKKYNQVFLATGASADCESMLFAKGETYAVEFEMPFIITTVDSQAVFNSTQFLPGIDHIAVGLRASNGAVIDGAPNDVLLYPPQDVRAASLKRHAEFSPGKDINACVALTFAFYSPKANTGKLRFRNFTVFRKADETFHFPREGSSYVGYGMGETAPALEKRNVKAFELVMGIEYNGEKAGTYSSEGNGMVITTPNNGVIATNSDN